MGINLIRGFFIILCMISGYSLGWHTTHSNNFAIIGLITALLIGLLTIYLEQKLRKSSGKIIIGSLIGVISGLIIANFLTYSLLPNYPDKSIYLFRLFINIIFAYVGLILGAKKGEGFKISNLKNLFKNQSTEENIKILDTSVIIDGRIADICETGFLEGIFIIPQFILHELQHIADSSDSLKRNRGRRGLDILHKIQKKIDVTVQILEQDFPKIKEVDSKLVALAKMMNAKIITNDFNLNKVAELQGVTVLNINQLANSVKPVVLPGEIMNVFILREGKEAGQGVAYLDDGTMVVVDNAKKLIGKNIEVSVTSVLQTTAGRMIFTQLKDAKQKESGTPSLMRI